MATPLAAFGPGILIVQNVTNPTPAPVNVGYAQELTIDNTGTTKDLFGQNQYPLVSARGTIKATGKIKAAVLSGLAWNAVFFGQSMTPGGYQWNINEKHTLAATTQQVTNHTTFDTDLGVTYVSSRLPLQRVAAGSETTGFYSVSLSTGTYTVSVSDSTAYLQFTYTNDVTTGQSLIVQNQPIGQTPAFQLDYYTNLNQPTAKPFAVRLYSCIANKLSIATKLEDYVMPEIDFGFFDRGDGIVWDAVFPEVS